jgi:hypothetical protein
MNLDDYMTEKELATMLRQPLLKIQEWRRIGYAPPHIRVSFKVTLYKKSDVMAWLEARRVEPVNRRRQEEPVAAECAA